MNNSKVRSNSSASVCAVIPFYNEKNTLSRVLDLTSKYVDHIFAINDGSDDDLYLEEKKKLDVSFIELEKNYGKGKALSKGFEAAVSNGFELVVTIDADLQHDPEYIPDLISGIRDFDIVIGNRLKNLKEMPLQRRLSNKLTSYFLKIKTGQKIIDSQCGFRAYKSKVINEVKTIYNGYEAESEIFIKAAKKGYRIGFIDITTIYGTGKSKMRPLQAITGFIKVLMRS